MLGIEAMGESSAVHVEALKDGYERWGRYAPVKGPADDVEILLA